MPDIASLFVFPFFLIFMRLGACIMVYPGFTDMAVNMRVRLLLAVFCSLAMFPILEPTMPLLPESNLKLISLIGVEIAVGIMMGISARLFIAAMHVAGELISFSAGLQASTLFDPGMGGNSTAPSLFLSLIASVLIFVTNLHHVMLLAVMDSYNMFPAGNLPDLGDAAKAVTQVVANLFILGLKLSAPVVAVGFVLYASLGVFNRLIPQLQVFFVAMPLTIFLGLFVLSMVLGALVAVFAEGLHDHAVLFTQE